jgi:hypothetical protein
VERREDRERERGHAGGEPAQGAKDQRGGPERRHERREKDVGEIRPNHRQRQRFAITRAA